MPEKFYPLGTPIVSSCSDAVNTAPALGEVSERDKLWDNRRSNADCVANHYRGSEFEKYADRIDCCSQLLGFKLVPNVDLGELILKLSSAHFCRVRHCPVCQWRRALMWKAKAYGILPEVVKDFPSCRWLFLTLTVKNCQISELRDELVSMNKAWQRLVKLRKFPAIGWIKSMEVTRGTDNLAHPHFHCLLLVRSGYFAGKTYLKQSEWSEMWQRCLRVDYQPILNIQAVKKGTDPASLVPELLKYCVKESDLIENRDWFLELTKQLHKMRAVSVGGVLKDYLKTLEREPEDLVGQGDEDGVDEGHLYFGWRKYEKKYRMT